MEKYLKPEMEIVEFDNEDIITDSDFTYEAKSRSVGIDFDPDNFWGTQ